MKRRAKQNERQPGKSKSGKWRFDTDGKSNRDKTETGDIGKGGKRNG